MDDVKIHPGVGIYQRRDVSRLLGIPPLRVRRWLDGYTYSLRDELDHKRRRRLGPVISCDLPAIRSIAAVSFLELMELRVIRSLLEQGVSLQYIRSAASVAADMFQTRHPFASRRVFTDGQAIYSAVTQSADDSDLVRWEAGRILQVIAGTIVDPYVREIDYDPSSSLAFRWWPKGREFPVVLDPKIGFGAPILERTGIRTAVLSTMAARVGVEVVADAFNVEVVKAQAAVTFEAELAAA